MMLFITFWKILVICHTRHTKANIKRRITYDLEAKLILKKLFII